MPVFKAASSGRWPGSTPNSPSTLGAVRSWTGSASEAPSGDTISSWMCVASAISGDFLQLPSGFFGFLDVADHVEGLLGQVVAAAVQDLLEARDGFLERDVLAGAARELRGHEVGLRQ